LTRRYGTFLSVEKQKQGKKRECSLKSEKENKGIGKPGAQSQSEDEASQPKASKQAKHVKPIAWPGRSGASCLTVSESEEAVASSRTLLRSCNIAARRFEMHARPCPKRGRSRLNSGGPSRVKWTLWPAAFLGIPRSLPRLDAQLWLLDNPVREFLHGTATFSGLAL
jgi:hypothetical protein